MTMHDDDHDGPTEAELLDAARDAAHGLAQQLGAEIVETADAISARYRGQLFASAWFAGETPAHKRKAWESLMLSLVSARNYRDAAARFN